MYVDILAQIDNNGNACKFMLFSIVFGTWLTTHYPRDGKSTIVASARAYHTFSYWLIVSLETTSAKYSEFMCDAFNENLFLVFSVF